jgi:hypothetical protein
LHPLAHLVELVNTEGGLKSVDVAPVIMVIDYLADRLRLVDYVRRNPAVRDEKLDVVGVIVGLPRGGSTLLQRLLCTSPQLTATKVWELRCPIPEPGEKGPAARIAKAQGIIDALFDATPGMKGMHPMVTDDYDEEVLFIDRSFLCIDYAHYFNIPSYDRWDPIQDHTKAYEELILWLQVLQFNDPQRRGKRWLLKSPHHLLGAHLRPMLQAFPTAKAIMTHRTLESVIASYCSLQASMIRNYSDSLDETQSGRHAIEIFREGLQSLIRIRQDYPADRFIDVRYNDVIANPIAEFRRVMQLMGLKVGPEDESAATTWMQANPRDKSPPHNYRLEDYGTNAQQLNETFGFYRDAFLRPRQ